MVQKTVVISINSSWNIVNFRSGLIVRLKNEGHRVVALAPPDRHTAVLEAMGVECWPIRIDNQGVSPAKDLLLLWRYYKVLFRIRPDVFLGYTAKPNIYGSLAAQFHKVPVINNVSGLGTAFIKQGLLTRIVTTLYRLAFARSATVFFQNQEDMEMFVSKRIVAAKRSALLPGSGLNLARFKPGCSERKSDPTIKFILIARLLWDKGVGEFAAAARQVKLEFPHARFQLLGFLDVANRTAVARSDLDRWVDQGVVEYLGETDDVRPHIEAADCVVLPSYREGLPRVLLEGSAMGKPLIATDVPGCRHVVEEGRNGYLCAVRDPDALAEAMARMIRIGHDQRQAMGAAGRERVEREFDEQIAIDRYLTAIEQVLQPGRAGR